MTARAEPVHGTYSAYTHGCHCEQCRGAQAAYRRTLRQRQGGGAR